MFTVQTKTQTATERLAALDEVLVLDSLFGFMDVATTMTSRATFYNTKDEQRKALETIHNRLFQIERSIYAASLMLPGMNDYSKQIGIKNLLMNKRQIDELLTNEQERALVEKIITSMPVHRMLNLFIMLREQRINNARTRKIILRSVLNGRNLELWSVRYRKKMVLVLEHAWGKRMTGILRSILSKTELGASEENILKDQITRYVKRKDKAGKVLESVGFVLGNREHLTLPLLKAFVEAKEDIFKGQRLPYEVLEGIRGRYFKNELDSSDILDLTKNTLTTSQKMTLQNKAKTSGVQVTMNPLDYDAVRLYIYAYSQGMTTEIREALNVKARQAAKKMPMAFNHIGILVDGSASMFGSETQALRPIATACATRDMLRAVSDFTTIRYAGGIADDNGLVQVEGDTTLATHVIDFLEKGVEAIFILTDGYENAPAGRVGEVIRLARQIGIDTPIFQASPVAAAEASGLRTLSKDILTLGVSQPDAMAVGLLKAQLKMNLQSGVQSLLKMTVHKLTVSQ